MPSHPPPTHLTTPHTQATQIGYALSVSGCISIFLQLCCMPYLLRRFDHAHMYNFCMGLWPLCFALLPGLNFLAAVGTTGVGAGPGLGPGVWTLAPSTYALLWLAIGVIMLIARCAALAFS